MRKFITSIILIFLIISCTQQKTNVKKETKVDKFQNVENETLVSLSKDSLKKKKLKEAKEYLSELKEREVNNYDSEILWGRYYYAKNNYNKSKEIFKNLYTKYPRNSLVNYYMGLINNDQKFYSAAVRYFLKAYRNGYRSRSLILKLTDILMREGNYPRAISFFHDHLKNNKKDPYIRYNLAMAYYYSGKTQDGIDQLKLSSYYNKNYPLTYYGLGYIYYNLAKNNSSYKYDARRYLNKFLKLENNRNYLIKRAKKYLKNLRR